MVCAKLLGVRELRVVVVVNGAHLGLLLMGLWLIMTLNYTISRRLLAQKFYVTLNISSNCDGSVIIRF